MSQVNTALNIDKHLTMPELGLPLAYTIPHEWGGLHVTENAHDAYGIVPLSPNVVPGGKIEFDKARPQVDVLLIGPDEFEHRGTDLYARGKIYKGGLGLAVGFPLTHEQLTARIQDELEEIHPKIGDFLVEAEHEEEVIIPTDEYLKNILPQQNTRIFMDAVENMATGGLMAWSRQHEMRKFYNRMVANGAIGLVGFGLVCAPYIKSAQGIPPQAVAVGFTVMGIKLNALRHSLKRHINNEGKESQASRLSAQVNVIHIMSGLRSDLSSAHFDASNQALLDDMGSSEGFET